MEITLNIKVKGKKKQLVDIVQSLIPSENAGKIISDLYNTGSITFEDESGSESFKDEKNDKTIEDVFDVCSWRVFHLAHIIFTHNGGEDDIGRYMSQDDLLKYAIDEKGTTIEKRGLSNRVGGAKKVTKRKKTPDIFIIKAGKQLKGKQYYLTTEGVQAVGNCLKNWDREYRDWLNGKEYFYPGEEE